jgi:hypothetical protein
MAIGLLWPHPQAVKSRKTGRGRVWDILLPEQAKISIYSWMATFRHPEFIVLDWGWHLTGSLWHMFCLIIQARKYHSVQYSSGCKNLFLFF